MSKGSVRECNNLAPSEAARKQAVGNVLKAQWTPVLCRGKIRICARNPEAAANDPSLPAKLNDSVGLATFVGKVLPNILAEMKEAHGWNSVPRTLVHDKASYMVAPHHDRLNIIFASSLSDAGLKR